MRLHCGSRGPGHRNVGGGGRYLSAPFLRRPDHQYRHCAREPPVRRSAARLHGQNVAFGNCLRDAAAAERLGARGRKRHNSARRHHGDCRFFCVSFRKRGRLTRRRGAHFVGRFIRPRPRHCPARPYAPRSTALKPRRGPFQKRRYGRVVVVSHRGGF